MTIWRLPPTLGESYSTFSTFPRSTPSRRTSKPAGAGGSEDGGSARVRAGRRKGIIPSSRPIARFITGTSENRDRAAGRGGSWPYGGAMVSPNSRVQYSRSTRGRKRVPRDGPPGRLAALGGILLLEERNRCEPCREIRRRRR